VQFEIHRSTMATPRLGSRFGSEYPLVMGTQPAQSAPKSPVWDVLRVFGVFATMYLARGQTDRTRFWAIVAVAVLILLVGYYRLVFAAWQWFALRRHDRGVALKYGQEFRRLTLDAGHFVTPDPAYNDTLAAALGNVNQRLSSQPNNPLFMTLARIPQMQIFMDRWGTFNARIQRDSLTTEQFHFAVDELIGILRTYNSYCLNPIFHTFANEYREVLMESEKSHFNAVQQSYCAYVERVYNFVNRLNDDFHGLPELSAVMALPRPL
jgi:hypothetical protein